MVNTVVIVIWNIGHSVFIELSIKKLKLLELTVTSAWFYDQNF